MKKCHKVHVESFSTQWAKKRFIFHSITIQIISFFSFFALDLQFMNETTINKFYQHIV